MRGKHEVGIRENRMGMWGQIEAVDEKKQEENVQQSIRFGERSNDPSC